MEGTVKWFNRIKGFGFIQGEDGNDYFAHYTQIPKGVFLKENDRVSFDAVETDKGKQAQNVNLLEGGAAPEEEKPEEEAPAEEPAEEQPEEEKPEEEAPAEEQPEEEKPEEEAPVEEQPEEEKPEEEAPAEEPAEEEKKEE